MSGQYLKFDEIYVFANTCACLRFRNFLIRKKSFDIVICFVTNIFCICRLKSILSSRVISSSSAVSDDLMVFPSKDLFFLYVL